MWRLDVKVVPGVRHVRELGQDVGRHHHLDNKLRSDPNSQRSLQDGRCRAHR